jgi:hypothetical protein
VTATTAGSACSAWPGGLPAAARGLSWPAVLLPTVAAALLIALAMPVLDDRGWASVVLHGTLLLLALAVAGAVDEPESGLLDASPTAFRRRVLARLAVALLLTAPVVAAVSWHVVDSSGSAMLALSALAVVALALSASLRRWAAVAEPALLTGPLLVVGLLLGRWLAPYLPGAGPTERQTWLALLVAGTGVLAVALREPSTAGRIWPLLRPTGPASRARSRPGAARAPRAPTPAVGRGRRRV